MYLEEESFCDNGVELWQKRCNSFILLPAGKKYKAELDLELTNKSSCPIWIEMRLEYGCDVICSKKYSCDAEKYYMQLKDTLILETPARCCESMLSIKLLSPEWLKICKGKISITEEKCQHDYPFP